MKNVLTLNVIIKNDEADTVIISSKEKRGVIAFYHCKTAEDVANAVERYVEDSMDN